ncbi:hypothetical protein AB5V95_02030 [Metamycoplasma spumans]|uniref:hypothetical protein n=1 Tax=Metamycoplasma spumans TaxID=92406 RepID=UPI0034DD45EF
MQENNLRLQNWIISATAIMAAFFVVEIINFIKKNIICTMYKNYMNNISKGANNESHFFN